MVDWAVVAPRRLFRARSLIVLHNCIITH